jgi:small subunit ribosomal protein S6
MVLYETVFILDSLLSPDEIDKLIDRVKDLLESNNCKNIVIDRWGKRRLAYEIRKKQYGYYVAIEFDSDGTALQLLNNEYNYNDKVLRYLNYRYDKNKLKEREQIKQKEAKKVEEKPEIKVSENGKNEILDKTVQGKEAENEKTEYAE